MENSRWCTSLSATTCAAIDALSSLLGISLMILGLVNIPADGSEEVTAARKLMIAEAVLLTIQLFQTFVHYFAGLSGIFVISVCWLLVTVPLLLAQLIVVVVSVTHAAGLGIYLFAGAFAVSFIFKTPQIFNMLKLLARDRSG